MKRRKSRGAPMVDQLLRATAAEPLPPVAEVLDVDREYRRRATAAELSTIAPRRCNPTGDQWLPIMQTTRGHRHYTALFSNTENAHRLDRTHDWVVISFDGRGRDQQCTVVTSAKGPLAGRRVVRGREVECIAHYRLNASVVRSRRRARRESRSMTYRRVT
ncbi:MAG TPA: hypothetical protein VH559_09300 [Gemmatimonadaceae bacterium]